MGEVKGSGPEKQPIDFKTGRSGFTWKGLAPDTDPQDLPEDTPRQLTNMRLVGGRVESRGGQLQLCDLQHKVTGMHNHRTGADRSLYILHRFRDEADPTLNGMSISVYNEEKEEPYKFIGEYYDGQFTLDYGGAFGIYGDDVLFSFETGIGPLGLNKIVTEDSKEQELLVEFPTPTYTTCSSIIEHEGVALVAVVGDRVTPTNDCLVCSWDGTTFTPELTGMYTTSLHRFRSTAIASANGFFRIRSSSGTWGSPIASTGVPRCSYRDLLYCTSPTDAFQTFDGASFTAVPKATVGIAVTESINNVVVFEDKMYFTWIDTITSDVNIGSYDGTTWIPSIKVFDELAISEISDLVVYKSALMMSGLDGSGVPFLLASAFDDIAGTWKIKTPSAWVTGTRPVQELLPY